VTDWDVIIRLVLVLLSQRAITPDQAAIWLEALVDRADQREVWLVSLGQTVVTEKPVDP
jgi:hypothetical protein